MLTIQQEKEAWVNVLNCIGKAKYILLLQGYVKTDPACIKLDEALNSAYRVFEKYHPMEGMEKPVLKLWKLVPGELYGENELLTYEI